jgi:hypothetical protein
MNYYILPKKNDKISINIKTTTTNMEKLEPYVSSSVYHYLNVVLKQIEEIKKKDALIKYDLIYKISNPYEFIFSNVPGLKYSVSKLKPLNNIFYIFMEILINFNILDFFNNGEIKTFFYGKNISSTIECMNMLREDYNDIYQFHSEIQPVTSEDFNSSEKKSFDFMFFELKNYINKEQTNEYIINMIRCLQRILIYQKKNGICVIKLNNLFYKPLIDILYILTNLYEKIYVVKMNTTNIVNGERIIVCKNFIQNDEYWVEHDSIKYLGLANDLQLQLEKMTNGKSNGNGGLFIESIIDNKLPYYFINKIEDSNVNIGHSQIEQLDLILYMIKNKNRDEKIETIKKNNIIKCVQWCEKYKIPYNKCIDKINIFLPCVNYIAETIEEVDNNIHNQRDYDDIDMDDEIISKILNTQDIINDDIHI